MKKYLNPEYNCKIVMSSDVITDSYIQAPTLNAAGGYMEAVKNTENGVTYEASVDIGRLGL